MIIEGPIGMEPMIPPTPFLRNALDEGPIAVRRLRERAPHALDGIAPRGRLRAHGRVQLEAGRAPERIIEAAGVPDEVIPHLPVHVFLNERAWRGSVPAGHWEPYLLEDRLHDVDMPEARPVPVVAHGGLVEPLPEVDTHHAQLTRRRRIQARLPRLHRVRHPQP